MRRPCWRRRGTWRTPSTRPSPASSCSVRSAPQCLAASGRYDAAGVRLRAAGRRFGRIGAGAYLAQAAGVAGRLGIALDDPPGLLAGLTGAERRVAQLARGDLSNEEIARQLSIQRGSVEFHLTSIYRKLGVAGRTALRRMLAEPE